MVLGEGSGQNVGVRFIVVRISLNYEPLRRMKNRIVTLPSCWRKAGLEGEWLVRDAAPLAV